jgi:iron complex transport system substrate-binding protein
MMKKVSCLFFLTIFLVQGCEKKRPVQGIMVTDYFGTEIRIPDKIERIIPIFSVQSEYMCIVGARDKIVGVGNLRPDNTIFARLFPNIYTLPVVGAQTINLEKILQLHPDVVVCGHNRKMIENIQRLNLIAVGTFPRDINGIFEQIRIAGIVAHKEGEAEKIITYLKKELLQIREKTALLAEKNRPRVYYARYDPFETMGDGIYSEIIDVAGGKNVVSGIGKSGQAIIVSLENIYKWNPDIIILRDKAPITANTFYQDAKWKGINAIVNKQIYREHRNWSEFRVETFFGIMEKAKWFHPDLFLDLSPSDEYEQFFRLIESFYE